MGECEVESLNKAIEAAWDALTDLSPSVRRTLYLTKHLHIFGLIRGRKPLPTMYVIGTFTATVDLSHFREAVFHVYQEIKGDRHG